MTLEALIDKQDSFEIIRDQIAAILVTEVINQKALAVAAAEDPALWDFKVYIERSNPWEQFLNDPTKTTPIVNVWFDNNGFDLKASNVIERQKATGVFNIDCYGFAVSEDDGGTGHLPGDREAALNAQRVVRLVRNILMAAENTYLQLGKNPRVAWDRMPQSITMFQPSINQIVVQDVIAARLALNVSYNEFSPQITGEIMELLSIDIKLAEDGSILVEADYEYPL